MECIVISKAYVSLATLIKVSFNSNRVADCIIFFHCLKWEFPFPPPKGEVVRGGGGGEWEVHFSKRGSDRNNLHVVSHEFIEHWGLSALGTKKKNKTVKQWMCWLLLSLFHKHCSNVPLKQSDFETEPESCRNIQLFFFGLGYQGTILLIKL